MLDKYLKINELKDRLVNGRKDPMVANCLAAPMDGFKLDGKFADKLWARQSWFFCGKLRQVIILLFMKLNSRWPGAAMLDMNRLGGMETKWASNAQIAVKKEEDHWAIEIILRIIEERQEEMDQFSGIPGRRATKTFPFYFNVCRQRNRSDFTKISAFSPTGKDSFYVPIRFAKVYVK